MSGSAGGSRTSEDEMFLLFILGLFALAAAAGSVGYWGGQAVAWLLEHRALVPARAHPLVVLPSSGGAGLDLPRLSLLLAAVIGLLVAAVHVVRPGPAPSAS